MENNRDSEGELISSVGEKFFKRDLKRSMSKDCCLFNFFFFFFFDLLWSLGEQVQYKRPVPDSIGTGLDVATTNNSVVVFSSMTSISKEIAYGTHPLQRIKFFHYSPANTQCLVFVHGGAWRDPTNTYDDFKQLAQHLQSQIPNFNFVGVNYRLSPEVKHPEHLMDLGAALLFLSTSYNMSNCVLLGHSVGATLLMQLVNYNKIIELVGVTVPAPLAVKISGMVFVDGIYDMVDLIEEYGSLYEEFVDNAFTNADGYINALQMTWKCKDNFDAKFKILVVQSLEDELLSLRQTKRFVEYLKNQEVIYELDTGDWGRHEEVYRREELAQTVRKYLESL